MEKSSWNWNLGVYLIAFPLLVLAAIAVYSQNPVTAEFFEKWSLNHRASVAAVGRGAGTKDYASISPAPSPDPGRSSKEKKGIEDQQKPQHHEKDVEEEDAKRQLNGLLAAGFDENSCLSRYESYLYRKPSPHKPSPSLLANLRRYEDLHRKCGPGTQPYKNTLIKLTTAAAAAHNKDKSPHQSEVEENECKYIIWLQANGLGNRMISLAATFLYAILTNRTLLVEFPQDMTNLFCEPFLNSSWSSPTAFSTRNINLPTYEHIINLKSPRPSVAFLDLQHHREDHEQYFHCNHGQDKLNSIPIIVSRTDQYFVPSLFITPYFNEKLSLMFPQKELTFHFLSRYLFHPTNHPWGLITRFHQSYLAESDQRIGLQIRLFASKITPKQTVLNQIISCTITNNILPPIINNETTPVLLPTTTSNKTKTKAVLIASLYPEFSESLRDMYWSNPTTTGEFVQVFQPTHEGAQKFNNGTHELKALVEIYLLSLCDVLVTSGLSTFGYVAQGLGGLKPWIMGRTVGPSYREPACERVVSMEPCYHFPPKYDCQTKKRVDHITEVFGDVMEKCKDWSYGAKMVDRKPNL